MKFHYFIAILLFFVSCMQNTNNEIETLYKPIKIKQLQNYRKTISPIDNVVVFDSSAISNEEQKRFYFVYLKYNDNSFIKIYVKENNQTIYWEWGKDNYSRINIIETGCLDFYIKNKNEYFIFVGCKFCDIILKIKPNYEFYKIKNDIPYIILGYNYEKNIIIHLKEIEKNKIFVESLNYETNKKNITSFDWGEGILMPQTISDSIIYADKKIIINYLKDSTNIAQKEINYP